MQNHFRDWFKTVTAGNPWHFKVPPTCQTVSFCGMFLKLAARLPMKQHRVVLSAVRSFLGLLKWHEPTHRCGPPDHLHWCTASCAVGTLTGKCLSREIGVGYDPTVTLAKQKTMMSPCVCSVRAFSRRGLIFFFFFFSVLFLAEGRAEWLPAYAETAKDSLLMM